MGKMKYVKCPTCGGDARYVSPNFETAKILISTQNEHTGERFKHLMQIITDMNWIVDKKIEDYSADQLYFLYMRKLQYETVVKQITIDHSYFAVNEGYKRMQEEFGRTIAGVDRKMWQSEE